MKSPRPLIVGNWKMNGSWPQARRELDALVKFLLAPSRPRCDVAICPPATLIVPMAARIKEKKAGRRLALGGQTCHAKPSGAHTGDIAAEMLREAGAGYVIVGHSERRQDHGETDAQVQAQAQAAHRAGLVAILCVGETLADYDAGRTLPHVLGQLAQSLPPGAHARNTVVAYEPVWAIGTGRVAGEGDIRKVHGAIRDALAKRFSDGQDMRILYGGSVKPDNAEAILRLEDVQGALVGGASLKSADFSAILKACP